MRNPRATRPSGSVLIAWKSSSIAAVWAKCGLPLVRAGLRTTGDPGGAMAHYREALAIARQLSAADPGSFRRKGLCGQILTGMGAVAAQNGAHVEAARDHREGLDLLKLLADRSGANGG
jgi:hypothetical protein